MASRTRTRVFSLVCGKRGKSFARAAAACCGSTFSFKCRKKLSDAVSQKCLPERRLQDDALRHGADRRHLYGYACLRGVEDLNRCTEVLLGQQYG